MNPLIAHAPASVASKETRESGAGVFLLMLLLAGCLGLGWVVYQQLMASPAPRPLTVAPAPIAPLPELPEVAPFIMAPADHFAAVLDRPLFSPTRRQPSEAVPEVIVAKDPLDLELTGVIASRGQRTAIFRPKVAAPAKTPQSRRKERREKKDKRAKRAKRTPPVAPAAASIQLSEGDDYKGWKLEQIEVDSALFVRDEEETWLEINFDVAAPVQPRQPKQQAPKRRWPDEDDRDVTPKERRMIMGVLKGEGCPEVEEMELEDDVFLVEEVECEDGRTYEVTLDRDFKIIAKERED